MEIVIALLLSLGLGGFFAGDGDDPDTQLPTGGEDDPVDPVDNTKGTIGDDVVVLTSASEVFDGLDGNDSIEGGAGFDTLFGSEGQDEISGDNGKDELYGGNGADSLYGGSWNDDLYGGKGFDDLFGGNSNDFLNGAEGKDLLDGGAGNDTMNGGSWNDGLFGGDGNDTMRGGSSNDMVIGGAGDDLLRGGDGNDVVFGGTGADSVFGGDGNDFISGASLFNRDLDADDYAVLREGGLPKDENGDILFENWGLDGTSDVGGNMLSGGDGNDTIVLGQDDVARGGDGSDTFITGDWVTADTAPEITDFSTDDDTIVIALANADSVVTTNVVDGDGIISVDGVEFMTVDGDFTAEEFAASVATTTYVPEVTAAEEPAVDPVPTTGGDLPTPVETETPVVVVEETPEVVVEDTPDVVVADTPAPVVADDIVAAAAAATPVTTTQTITA